MLSPEHQELLSAHFDGELASEERARVDTLLNESQEARELLQEFDEISAAVRNVDVPALPDGLRDAVLAQIRPAAPKPLARRPRWHRWAAPVLAASLALTVAVFLQQQVQQPATDLRVADHVISASPAELDDSIQPGDLSESAETALAFSAVTESSPAQPEATRSLSPLETDAMRLSSDAPDGLSTRLFPYGSQPVPGETRSLLVQQGDIPVVVNYTVVDVEKAAGQMRVFLSGNGIHHIVTTTPPEKPDVTGNEIENAPDARYVALLVDAPQDQVVAALNDFDSIQEVVDVDADYVEVSNSFGVEAEALPYRMQQKWEANDESLLPRMEASRQRNAAPGSAVGGEARKQEPASRMTTQGTARPAAPSPSAGALATETTNGVVDSPASAPKPRQLTQTATAGMAVQMAVSEQEVRQLMERQYHRRRVAESYPQSAATAPARPPAPPEPEPLETDGLGSQQGLSSRRVKLLLILQDQSDQ
ncbi:hypothetical protein [Maioricimonas sp. JC845]|uniref:anti-sigma factor family protein n=1 Tax=Maioricimonas sp. JC845 TaxID=3232138 RepID=UPI003457D2E9